MKATLGGVFYDHPKGRRSGTWKAIVRYGDKAVEYVPIAPKSGPGEHDVAVRAGRSAVRKINAQRKAVAA